MNTASKYLRGSLVLLAASAALGAAEAAKRSRWHVDAGPTLLFNDKLAYGAKPGSFPALTPRTDRIYDDGFNRVDASNNLGDGTGGALASRTGYFGFQNDSQVDLRAGTLALSKSAAAAGEYLAGRSAARKPGIEVNVRLSLRPDQTDRRDWGLEAGADFARFRDGASGPVTANLQTITDRYPLGGVVPQRAPYSGRFSPLPGDQRIGDTPVRTESIGPGTLAGSSSFKARTTVLRVGPWLELLPEQLVANPRERDRWALLGRAGFAWFTTRASFAIDEQIQRGTTTGARVTAAASRRENDLGWFAGLTARRRLGERTALLVGGDYLSGHRVTVSDQTRFARLDLRELISVRLALEIGWRRR